MRNLFYLNVNGFYGLREKNRDSLLVGVDNDYCVGNAKRICDRILENEEKYDVVFFSEFAPNTQAGKMVTKCFAEHGYRLVLPNSTNSLPNRYYSVVVAFVKEMLGVTKSAKSPNGWLTWCELMIDKKKIVGIHSTRTEFLVDMKTAVKRIKENKYDVLILGDTNVTEYSETKDKELIKEMSGYVGREITDVEEKMTFRGIRKPDRVFSSMPEACHSVISGYYEDKLSDHEALHVMLP